MIRLAGRNARPTEHRGCPQNADHVRRREVPKSEETERDERRGRPRLDREEGAEERTGKGQQAERPSGDPADLVAVDDRVDREHQGRRHGDRPREVKPSRFGRGVRTGEHGPRQDQHGDPDRDIDEEDPVPVERARQDPAREDADRSTARSDETEEAHSLRPLRRLREESDDERERNCRRDRACEALHRSEADELRLRGGEPGPE
jgi:hypothetical protein